MKIEKTEGDEEAERLKVLTRNIWTPLRFGSVNIAEEGEEELCVSEGKFGSNCLDVDLQESARLCIGC